MTTGHSILWEDAVIGDDLFHVVPDRDPVCAGHYLALPRAMHRSLAEVPQEHTLDLEDLSARLFGRASWAFFERGNAAFCTSTNGPVFAHAHLVAMQDFDQRQVALLISQLPHATRVRSLADALGSVSDRHEYLVAGVSGDWWAVSPFASKVKRYIRSLLQECRVS